MCRWTCLAEGPGSLQINDAGEIIVDIRLTDTLPSTLAALVAAGAKINSPNLDQCAVQDRHRDGISAGHPPPGFADPGPIDFGGFAPRCEQPGRLHLAARSCCLRLRYA